MRLGKAIALVAVLGLVGLAATTMVHAGGAGCGANSKASMQGCSGSPGHATMQKTGSSCSGHASADRAGGFCPAMGKNCCGSAKGASMQCSMAPTDCEKTMRTYYKTHGWLGIEMETADGSTAPTVTSIVKGSPAEKAGFKVGDALTSINGVTFDEKNAEALQGIMDNGFQVGQTVTYTAQRESKVVTLTPVLVSIPDASLNQMIATHFAAAHKQQEKSS
jgi:membrane-associated protease RseP (regulator of RpoE activity)